MKLGKASRIFQQHFNHQNQDLYDEFIKGTKPSLRNLFNKKISRKDKAKVAREFVWGVGLLYRIIKLKVDYIVNGFDIYHEDSDTLKVYEELNEEINMEEYVRNAAFEHEVIGEWCPFLSWNGNNLNTLTILNPEQLEIKSVFGKDFIYLNPPEEIRKLLRDPDPEVQRRVREAVPSEYYEKWKNGEKVLLGEDEVLRYTNTKAFHENNAHSPLEPIFDDLALLSLYKESDYSVAYKIKKAILHIKVGDSDVFDDEPVPEHLIEQAEEMFDGSSDSYEVFTQYFLDADWIIPDTDVYSPEKYKPVIRRILEWSGMSIFLSEDSSYSDADIKAHGFFKDVQDAREKIKESILDIYTKIAKKKGLKTYGDKLKLPEVKFSGTTFLNNEEKLEIVRFLYKHGLLSPDTTLNEFGFDFDEEIRVKSEEDKQDKYLEYITVPFEPSQDISMRSFLRDELKEEQEDNGEEDE